MHSILIKVETCIKKKISTVSRSLILNCPPPLVSCFEQEPTDILIIHTPNNPTNLTLPWVFTLSVLFKHVLMFVWSSFKEFCNYVSSSTITFSLLWQKEIVCFLFCFFQLCEHWMLIGSQHQTHHQCRCPLLSKRLLFFIVFFSPSAQSFKLSAANHYVKQAGNLKNQDWIYKHPNVKLILQYANALSCADFCRRVADVVRLYLAVLILIS